MKLFVYEFVTGGGTWHSAGKIDPTGSLLAEGAAMARGAIADLLAAGIEVTATLDARLRGQIDLPCDVQRVTNAHDELAAFDRLVRQADATLLIAPEIGGILLARCRRVEHLGGRLISPDSRFVAIAADKQVTAERLCSRDVRVPPGVRLGSQWEGLDPALFPAVLKPCDGAGSWQVARLDDADQLRCRLSTPALQQELRRGNLRLERFVPGKAASVAVLCGPLAKEVLQPSQQILAGEFEYQGGRLPLSSPLATRARRLAESALEALPRTVGYVGVDMILGSATDGSEDCVIEVNPRLTTSYVGLRAACRQNLAAAMVDVALGRPVTLSFAREPLEFRADGSIVPANSDIA